MNGHEIAQTWKGLHLVWKLVTGAAAGIISIGGAVVVLDPLIVSEAEAAQAIDEANERNMMQTNEIINALQSLTTSIEEAAEEREDMARQRRIEDAIAELQRINIQIMYLNNLSERNADQELLLETLRMNQVVVRQRIARLRCIASGAPVEECSQ